MIRIKLMSVGKTKEAWLEEAIEEYQKRLSGQVNFEFLWYKDDQLLSDAIVKEKGVVLLDPEGKSFDSLAFADFMFRQVEKGGSRLVFAIGGAEGFSGTFKKAYPLISLSKLTFTHQMTRLILIEQIFRAFEIQKGTGYHK